MINFPDSTYRYTFSTENELYDGPFNDADHGGTGKLWTWNEAKGRWEPYLDLAFANLSDRTTADLPAINTPLSEALGLKADVADFIAHASTHVTGGADKIRDATAAQDGLMTQAYAGKLDGVEALADVTDVTNVEAAGALMDSEVDADIKTLALPANTTISAFGASLVGDADNTAARTTLGLGTAAAATLGTGAGQVPVTGQYATTDQGNTADSALQAAVATKTTPINDDTVDLQDFADAGARKLLTFANLWTWVLGKIQGTALAFTSETRPTSAGTGTPAATSLITRDDGDARFGQRIIKVAAADESRTPNDILYVADPVLTVELSVGTWQIDVNGFWNNNDDVCGMRIQLEFTGTSDHTKSPIFALAGTSSGSGNLPITGQTRPVGALPATMPRVLVIHATNRNAFIRTSHTFEVSVAGIYAVAWGQGTASDTSPVIRKAGSTMIALKLS